MGKSIFKKKTVDSLQGYGQSGASAALTEGHNEFNKIYQELAKVIQNYLPAKSHRKIQGNAHKKAAERFLEAINGVNTAQRDLNIDDNLVNSGQFKLTAVQCMVVALREYLAEKGSKKFTELLSNAISLDQGYYGRYCSDHELDIIRANYPDFIEQFKDHLKTGGEKPSDLAFDYAQNGLQKFLEHYTANPRENFEQAFQAQV